MRNCCVATPFKGVRVYVHLVMAMPGSETILEELMCSILGPPATGWSSCKNCG